MIAVGLKWVDRRPEIGPLDGVVTTDPRRATLSEADAAALEWALRCGDAWDEPVLAVTAGPDGADVVLRDAIACGCGRAVRVDLTTTARSSVVAAAMVGVLRDHDVRTVWCGDHSLDRGSGSVPAYLAAELGGAQALGLVGVDIGGPGEVVVLRRLDGGRRERLRLRSGGVLSVEGATARLRRASLPSTLATRAHQVEVRGAAVLDRAAAAVLDRAAAAVLRPYRPRARALGAPSGEAALDRIVELFDTSHTQSHGEVAVLDPPAAAERILAALAAWGYRAAPATT